MHIPIDDRPGKRPGVDRSGGAGDRAVIKIQRFHAGEGRSRGGIRHRGNRTALTVIDERELSVWSGNFPGVKPDSLAAIEHASGDGIAHEERVAARAAPELQDSIDAGADPKEVVPLTAVSHDGRHTGECLLDPK